MKNDTIAEVIALLNTANYDTETLNQKRNEVVSTLKKQLSIQRVSNQRELLIAFKDNYWNDEHEPSRMTTEHIDDYLYGN
jgi:hypothetical protein